MEWTCNQCGYLFEPQELRGEIQCPRCGTLQDDVRPVTKAPSGLSSLNDRTEMGDIADRLEADRTIIEPPPKDETSSQNLPAEEDETLFDQATQPAPSGPVTDPGTRGGKPERILDLFGPTLLVCLIFVLWVVWDKKLRPVPPSQEAVQTEVNKALSQSVRALRRGNHIEALLYSDEALRLDPRSELATEVNVLLHQPPPASQEAPPK
jgi:uncharacterized Zn finger protein (UPF0148 family)